VGRFLSVDPLVGNPLSAQDYNGYSYCGNNPLAFTDPSGYQKYAAPMPYMLPGAEFYLDRMFGGIPGGGFGGGGGGGGASGYSGMGSLDYGLPGQEVNGQTNGTGANGLYYDWVSGTMRSTATLQPTNYEVVDHFFQTKFTHSDGTTTYGEKTFSYTSLKITYDISSTSAKSGGGNNYYATQFDFGVTSLSLKFTAQENYGLNGSAFYKGYVQVRPYGDGRWYAEAHAKVIPANAGTAPTFYANISVYRDGKQVGFDNLSMSNEWGEHVDATWTNLGYGRVWLPANGDVQIRMVIGTTTFEFWNGNTNQNLFSHTYNLP